MKTSFLGIIPARFASTRFPGKPLVKIDGKTMIQHVWEQASKAIDKLVVATDDDRILKEVIAFGGYAVLTNPGHESGTDRCAEALDIYIKNTGKPVDVVVNIQGDEPFIQQEQILNLCSAFISPDTQIATLIIKCTDSQEIFDTNKPKVVIDKKKNAIYFSRFSIPFIHDQDQNGWHQSGSHYRHIGTYAYRSTVLKKLSNLNRTALEIAESLEQLRWIESGYQIRTIETETDSLSIDAPEDLERAKLAGLIQSYSAPE